jgi:hypothetical protein
LYLLILYLLGSAGITVVLVMSKVCLPLRMAIPPPVGFRGLDPEKYDRPILLACTLCTGTWVGALVGLFAFLPEASLRWSSRLCHAFLFAFAAALVSYLFGTWLGEHDRKH